MAIINYLSGFDSGEGPIIWTMVPNKGVNGYLQSWGGWDKTKFHMTPPAKFEDGQCAYTEQSSITELRSMHYPVNVIDFSDIGNKYQSKDLYGKGFQLTVNGSGLSTKFAFYFVPGTSINITSTGGMSPTFKVMVGVDNVTNGHSLAQRIVNGMSSDAGIQASSAVFAYTEQEDMPINSNCFVFWNMCHYSTSDGFIAESLWDEIGIVAEYKGPTVKVGNNYNKNDVEVQLVKGIPGYPDFNVYETLSSSQWTESGLKVTANGDNTFTATYHGMTDNYIVPGERVPEKISAVYKGPDIEIGKEYKKSDVEVTVIYNDGFTKVLTVNDWSESSLNVIQQGANNYTATYLTLTDSYTVNGYRVILKVDCEYVGPDIHVYNDYDKNDVVVTVYYKDSPAVPYIVPSNQYEITDTYVTLDGENIYTTQWTPTENFVQPTNTYDLEYIVPGVGISHIWAIYDGPEIWKTQHYSIDDVHVTVVYKDNCVENLLNTDCIFNPDTTIYAPYENEYEVKWIDPGDNEWTATYIVIGIAIERVYAEYQGPDILLMDEYETADVVIVAYVTNGTEFFVHHTECQFDDKLISWTGPNNKKHFIWIDPCGDIWNVEFIVPGIRRPLQIDVEYIGDIKYLKDKVEDDELKVTIHYLTDYFEEEREILEPGEWYWESLNIIDNDNKGWMQVGWSHNYIYTEIRLSARTKVHYIDPENAELLCWYEGPPIEVGQLFDKDHVVIYLCPKDEDRIRLHYYSEGIIMEISEVTKVGDNWYEVVFSKNDVKLTGRYAVPGVIYKEYPNPDFKVWYIYKDSLPGQPHEIDLTEDFRPYFTFRGEFVISWQQFLQRVYDYAHKDWTPYFGMFGIIAPKNTGLFAKYASWWHVYCQDDHTLKAEIYHLYDTPIKKEDNEDGSTENKKD